MKKYAFLLVLFLCSVCWAVDFPPDSNHVWHVSVDGNDDDNTGHAGQYPIDLAADAYLTINQAVSDACDGDTIIIWPGDYDETVNLDTANKSLTLTGTSLKSRIIRTGSGEDGIVLEDYTIIRNLTVSSTYKAVGTYPVTGADVNHIIIENCVFRGGSDGAFLNGCENILIKDSILSSPYDGLFYTNSTGLHLVNCVISTDGTYGTAVSINGIVSGSDTSEIILDNCTINVSRDDESASYAVGGMCKGQVVMNNCLINVTAGSDNTGDVYGVNAATTGQIVINNCNIEVSTAGAGTAYSLYGGASGTLVVSNSLYDTAATSGTITQGGSGWAAALETIVDANAQAAIVSQDVLTQAQADANFTIVIADTNETQTDQADGGRLDLIWDAMLADSNELQEDWADGGRLDLLLDAAVADLNDIQEDWATTIGYISDLWLGTGGGGF